MGETNEQSVVELRAAVTPLKSASMEAIAAWLNAKKSGASGAELLEKLHDAHRVALAWFNAVETFAGDSSLLGAHSDEEWVVGFAEDCHSMLDSIAKHFGWIHECCNRWSFAYADFSPSLTAYSRMQAMVRRYLPDFVPDLNARFIELALPTRGFAEPKRSELDGSSTAAIDRSASLRVVVMTALELEFEAVRSRLSNVKPTAHPKGTVYDIGEIIGSSQHLEVCLVQAGKGNIASAQEGERVIAWFDPDVAIFIGVGGGVKDVRVGDVVYGNKVYLYQSGKELDGKFLPRPEEYRAGHRVLGMCRAVARAHNRDAAGYAVTEGPIAAGEIVVAGLKTHTAELIAELYSDTIVVDMEAAGFLHAANANEVGSVVVRGISDLLAGKSASDSSGSQHLAALRATQFAISVLQEVANFNPGRLNFSSMKRQPEDPPRLPSAAERPPLGANRTSLIDNGPASAIVAAPPRPRMQDRISDHLRSLHGLGRIVLVVLLGVLQLRLAHFLAFVVAQTVSVSQRSVGIAALCGIQLTYCIDGVALGLLVRSAPFTSSMLCALGITAFNLYLWPTGAGIVETIWDAALVFPSALFFIVLGERIARRSTMSGQRSR